MTTAQEMNATGRDPGAAGGALGFFFAVTVLHWFVAVRHDVPRADSIAVEAAAIEDPPADIAPVAPTPAEAPDASAPAAPAVETAPVAVAAEAIENPPADVAPDAAPDVPAPTAPAKPVETAPVSLQTIANAYSDFARKSIEQTSSYFEQLARVRSLNKALELQTEFAKQTYETFVAESRKIHELHSELTMQRLRNLEGFVTRIKPTRST